MSKKKESLKYNKIDRVSRWNYIQFIGKEMLDCSIPDEQLKQICLDLQSGEYQLQLNIIRK